MTSLWSDRELMTVVHRKGSFYLFNDKGQPSLVRRWRSRKADTMGQVMTESVALESESLDQETRSEMRSAWNQYFNLSGA